MEDKKSRRMVVDERYVMCDRAEGRMSYPVWLWEFKRDWQVLLNDVCRIVGEGERLDEFRSS